MFSPALFSEAREQEAELMLKNQDVVKAVGKKKDIRSQLEVSERNQQMTTTSYLEGESTWGMEQWPRRREKRRKGAKHNTDYLRVDHERVLEKREMKERDGYSWCQKNNATVGLRGKKLGRSRRGGWEGSSKGPRGEGKGEMARRTGGWGGDDSGLASRDMII